MSRWIVWSLLLLALLAIPARGETIGVVTEVNGTARLLRAQNYLEAAKGVEVEPQDILETGKDASLQLDMEDGSVLKLGPGSRLVLSEYKLGQDRGVLSAGLDLLAGWLRFAVSKLRKADAAYKINAPVLTVGIRGTEGVIEAANEQGGLHLISGAVDVSGQDRDGRALPVVRVNAGEYIQRLQGELFSKLAAPPAAFQNRVPTAVQQKVAPKPLAPAERGVQPRIIRPVTREDARELIQKHPSSGERLKERFKPVIGPGATPLRPGGGFVPREVLDKDAKPRAGDLGGKLPGAPAFERTKGPREPALRAPAIGQPGATAIKEPLRKPAIGAPGQPALRNGVPPTAPAQPLRPLLAPGTMQPPAGGAVQPRIELRKLPPPEQPLPEKNGDTTEESAPKPAPNNTLLKQNLIRQAPAALPAR
jgi:hypothetical protein